MLTPALVIALIVKAFVGVLEAVGLLAITRILYPVPNEVPPGMVALIVPLFIEDKFPILVGVAKLPLAFESWAVNTLPTKNGLLTEYTTFKVAPGQKGPEIGETVIVGTPTE